MFRSIIASKYVLTLLGLLAFAVPFAIGLPPQTWGAVYEPGFGLVSYGAEEWVTITAMVIAAMLLISIVWVIVGKKEHIPAINLGLIVGLTASLVLRFQSEFYWLEVATIIAINASIALIVLFRNDTRAYTSIMAMLATVGGTTGIFVLLGITFPMIIVVGVFALSWEITTLINRRKIPRLRSVRG